MYSKDELEQLGVTPESLNHINEFMDRGNNRYTADENVVFEQALIQNPLNTDPATVAMKIALIDMTNSTNLSRLLGDKKFSMRGKKIERKVFTLSELIDKIVSTTDFDERVKQGDITLVSELTKWSKDNGANMMSFFSKYCLYHNNCIYKRDDYSIFDSVVQKCIGKYLNQAEFEQLFPGRTLRRNQTIESAVCSEIGKMRNNCDYEAYWKLIDDILSLKGIDIEFKRRKFDHFVWYLNR